MKTKLPLVLVLCYALSIVEVSGQSFFVKINGGYAWPGFYSTQNVLGPKIDPATPTTDALINMANMNDSAKTYSPTHGSYGKGFNISVRFGYMINPYFGVDLGLSYLTSASISCKQVRQAAAFINPNDYLTANISTHAYGLSMMPSFTVTGAKPGFKVYPYARVGLTLPVWGRVIHNVNIQVDPDPVLLAVTNHDPFFLGANNQVTLETKSTFSIGINGSVGVAYKPLSYLDIFAEINGQYLDVRAKSSTVTKWNSDGVNQIPARRVYRTQFNFVDQLTPSSNNEQYNGKTDFDKPKDDIRPIAPFSNLGFNVGVTFYFNKKKGSRKKNKPAEIKGA